MKMPRSSRRTFMKMAATGAITATGLLSGVGPAGLPVARAGGVPPRFLFLTAGAGWTPRATFMRPAFSEPSWGHWSDILRIAAGREIANTTPDPTQFEFSLTDPRLTRADMSRVLDPLWNMRSKTMAFEGLALLSTGWDAFGDGHAQNHVAVSTAGPAAYGYDGVKSHALYPSLDQRVLSFFKESDPLAISLNFNPNEGRRSGTEGFHYFLYGPNGSGGVDRLPTDGDPAVVAERLFGGMDLGDMDAERRRLARQAMFAQLQSHYGDLVARTSGTDRARLETHRMLLSELDARLARDRVACTSPVVGAVDGLPRARQIESDFDSFGDIIGASFACGLSRVATLTVSVPPEDYGLDPATDIHHEYEHNSDAVSYYEGPGNVGAEEAMIQRNVLQMTRVARLLERLDSLPDVDGGTVLDNTIVLYTSELADGNHNREYHPFLVFGGSATGRLGTGRYLKYPQDLPNPWGRNYRNEHTGTPHTRLYVGILQALGLDVNHIHDTSIAGSVPHLGTTGTIDMTGPLPRLG
jgi:hypothetical protein